MKVVILAGGLGTRLSEETATRPKPMVEIGDRPILWHIMKSYSHYGFNDFVVCLGYKGYVIKEFFLNYFRHMSDVTFACATRDARYQARSRGGSRSSIPAPRRRPVGGSSGRRIPRRRDVLLTYGDGVSDIDICEAFEFHRTHGKQATVLAVQPLGRFGSLEIDDDETVEGVVGPGVRAFQEKPVGDGAWVNGGFFVLEPSVLDRITGDDVLLSSVSRLKASQPMASWSPSDTLGSGNRWTLCGISVRCRPSGSRVTPRGPSGPGRDADLLSWPPRGVCRPEKAVPGVRVRPAHLPLPAAVRRLQRG